MGEKIVEVFLYEKKFFGFPTKYENGFAIDDRKSFEHFFDIYIEKMQKM